MSKKSLVMKKWDRCVASATSGQKASVEMRDFELLRAPRRRSEASKVTESDSIHDLFSREVTHLEVAARKVVECHEALDICHEELQEISETVEDGEIVTTITTKKAA